jgi:hypothetical protein
MGDSEGVGKRKESTEGLGSIPMKGPRFFLGVFFEPLEGVGAGPFPVSFGGLAGIMATSADDWLLDSIVGFLKSPPYTVSRRARRVVRQSSEAVRFRCRFP